MKSSLQINKGNTFSSTIQALRWSYSPLTNIFCLLRVRIVNSAETFLNYMLLS